MDIIERLRAKRVRGRPGFYNPDELCQEAADQIARLTAERDALRVSLQTMASDVLERNHLIAKLHSTLKPFAALWQKLSGPREDNLSGNYGWLCNGDVRRAYEVHAAHEQSASSDEKHP